MLQEIRRGDTFYGYSCGISVAKLADAMNLKVYDTALPQDWVDEVIKLVGDSPVGQCVWYYGNESYRTFGIPVAITELGRRILVQYADAKEKEKTGKKGCTKQDYRDALMVQTACNPRGVLNSLVHIMPRIVEDDPSTDAICSHPVFVLFVDKLRSLSKVSGFGDMSKAYATCREHGECDGDGRPIERKE